MMTLARFALTIGAVALFVGCGGSQPPTGTSGALPQSARTSPSLRGAASSDYTTLYSFGAGSDGQTPKADLIEFRGALYGTTYGGGANGLGTVFKVSPNGVEKVLYSFRGTPDGSNPSAALVAVKGLLYGTTEYGGIANCYPAPSCGTIFSVAESGHERVLHVFQGYYKRDAANPISTMIFAHGSFYGTTQNGGKNVCTGPGCGAVFRMNMIGIESVLYSFEAFGDGALPVANLIDVKGVLWGTTELGGSDSGVAFRLTPTGTETVVYTFGYPYSSVGCNPEAGMTVVNGTIYGTNAESGKFRGGTLLDYGDPSQPKVVHSFGHRLDGKSPAASLLNVKGTLYGTTRSGGAYGLGTIFNIDPKTGKETVLHSFGYGSDGATPLAGLIDVKGALYGTTSAGGTYGKGTVFALTP